MKYNGHLSRKMKDRAQRLFKSHIKDVGIKSMRKYKSSINIYTTEGRQCIVHFDFTLGDDLSIVPNPDHIITMLYKGEQYSAEGVNRLSAAAKASK